MPARSYIDNELAKFHNVFLRLDVDYARSFRKCLHEAATASGKSWQPKRYAAQAAALATLDMVAARLELMRKAEGAEGRDVETLSAAATAKLLQDMKAYLVRRRSGIPKRLQTDLESSSFTGWSEARAC